MSERSITVTHNGIDYVASVAKVEYTRLGAEDHGIFTASIGFVSGAWHQSMGDYCLDEPLRDADGSFLRREGTAYGLDHVMRLLWVFGVSKWEDVKGQSALVLRTEPFGFIKGVANLHDEDRVFIPTEHADEWRAREGQSVDVPS